MKRLLALLTPLLLATLIADAKVVRPAPDVALAPGSKPASIRGFKNQPVVILFAPSARDRQFKAQVKELEAVYRLFAARQVLFVAALGDGGAEPIRSSIPFLTAPNGGGAAAAYGIPEGRGIAIVSPEGNLDYVSTRRAAGARVREILANTQSLQAANRK